jgi:hypothetical protein
MLKGFTGGGALCSRVQAAVGIHITRDVSACDCWGIVPEVKDSGAEPT